MAGRQRVGHCWAAAAAAVGQLQKRLLSIRLPDLQCIGGLVPANVMQCSHKDQLCMYAMQIQQPPTLHRVHLFQQPDMEVLQQWPSSPNVPHFNTSNKVAAHPERHSAPAHSKDGRWCSGTSSSKSSSWSSCSSGSWCISGSSRNRCSCSSGIIAQVHFRHSHAGSQGQAEQQPCSFIAEQQPTLSRPSPSQQQQQQQCHPEQQHPEPQLLPASFEALGVAPELVTALSDQGFTAPTPVQAAAMQPVLSGRNVALQSSTGTGKVSCSSTGSGSSNTAAAA